MLLRISLVIVALVVIVTGYERPTYDIVFSEKIDKSQRNNRQYHTNGQNNEKKIQNFRQNATRQGGQYYRGGSRQQNRRKTGSANMNLLNMLNKIESNQLRGGGRRANNPRTPSVGTFSPQIKTTYTRDFGTYVGRLQPHAHGISGYVS